MNRKRTTIHLILWKYKVHQALSPKEEQELFEWTNASDLRKQLFEELGNDEYWQNELEAFRSKEGDPAWNVIDQRLEDIEYFESKNRKPSSKYFVAAGVLGVVVIGFVLFLAFRGKEKAKNTDYTSTIEKTEDVLPATNSAVLQLGDSSLIYLNKVDKKMLAMERFGMFISVEDGLLVYRTDMSTKVDHHTLYTPKATQYKVSLADGTKVWLNAGSSLSFPTSFNDNLREVELVGEAYFEVAKMPAKRFVVKAGNSSVNVLGTHFNVNAYRDEDQVLTTLLEGSVIVKTRTDSVKLLPGQQLSVEQSDKMRVSTIDVRQAVAWKEQMFWFQDQPIPEIMRQLERWYNVNVIFKGETKERFTGILPRDLTLGQMLSVLDSSGKFSFEVKNKTITVVP